MWWQWQGHRGSGKTKAIEPQRRKEHKGNTKTTVPEMGCGFLLAEGGMRPKNRVQTCHLEARARAIEGGNDAKYLLYR
jgi:hypothetical protein